MNYYIHPESVRKSIYKNTFNVSSPASSNVRNIILKEVDQDTWRIINNNISAVIVRSVRISARSNVWESVEEYFRKKKKKK
jgi:hypothetical protein